MRSLESLTVSCPVCGYAYRRIPKCANMTVMRTLAFHDPHIWYDDIPDVELPSLFGKTEDTSKSYIFTVVRNPYVRLLSAYLDKRHKIKRCMMKAESKRHHGGIKFEDFVHYLEKGGLTDNAHWAPQMCFMDRVDEIGNVEVLEQFLEKTCLKLFGCFFRVVNQTRPGAFTGANGKITEYYNDDLKKRVYRLYQGDFEQLDYLP